MRVRAALAALSALVLVLTVVFVLAGKAEGEAPGAPRSGQILAEPNPPHRVLGAPLDAATLDVAPVRKHKAHPTETRNRPQPVRAIPMSAVMRCIAHRESRGIPTARRHDGGTASGLFGFIDGTWHHYKGYAHAWQAPASVQIERFLIIWNGGKGRSNWYWKGHSQCW